MPHNPLNIDKQLIEHWNRSLKGLDAKTIIQWSIKTFPGLFQTTAFGLTGLCIIDIISKLDQGLGVEEAEEDVELVFVDTLYHFPQTLDLVEKVKNKYNFKLHVYKPKACETEADFQKLYGDQVWETDELKYDYLVKVEPLKRAYEELDIKVVFTGRRRSQGDLRNNLQIVEIDETLNVIKINPLLAWTFADVKSYIEENQVPYNELLDIGYKSIGDWHSTVPVTEGEDERSGRWKGKIKSECGIHATSKYAKFMINTEPKSPFF